MGQVILSIFLAGIPFLANESIIDRVNNYCEEKEGKTYDEILFVSVKEQKIYHMVENTIEKNIMSLLLKKVLETKKATI